MRQCRETASYAKAGVRDDGRGEWGRRHAARKLDSAHAQAIARTVRRQVTEPGGPPAWLNGVRLGSARMVIRQKERAWNAARGSGSEMESSELSVVLACMPMNPVWRPGCSE